MDASGAWSRQAALVVDVEHGAMVRIGDSILSEDDLNRENRFEENRAIAWP